MRIIGDVHGKLSEYIDIACATDEPSVCVGDVGFDYDKLDVLDANRHRIIGGNHDNYDRLSPHFLGDFGCHQLNNQSFFYVRGAYSIDKMLRIPNVSWWQNEELTYTQSINAIEAYKKDKPSVVITHTAPMEIGKHFMEPGMRPTPCSTSRMLQVMLDYHEPEYWYFGHFHVDKKLNIGKTDFRCLNELSYVDI